MSYCIVDVIYGIHRNDAVNEAIRALDDEDDEDGEQFGFENLYTSGGGQAGYCGVKLCEFDEVTDYALKVGDLNLSPTAEQKAEAEKMIASLPESIRRVAPPADVYLVFGSS